MDTDAAKDPEAVHRAELTGAYWLSAPTRQGPDCEWCARLRDADRRAAEPDPARATGTNTRTGAARAAMVGLALVTIVLAMAVTAAHL
ncbi:hypothetical protein ACFWXK_18550 [Streptomyces sp. NPDC059070]|uniref:hypothetical protein n=1 Tax=unclassified Streptomyces TaxID=2593676 RepID=UPI0034E23AED